MGTTTTTKRHGEESLEARLAALEQEMAELRQRFSKPEAAHDWLQKVTGAMKGRPEFLEMVEHGRRFRESLPYSDEDPEAW